MGLDSLSLLQAVFESTADGFLIVDLEGKVIHSNRRFQDLWKIPDALLATGEDEKLLNFILDQLLFPDKFLGQVRTLYTKIEASSEDTIEFRDGRYFARTSRPLISENKIIGRVWVFRDITEQKRSEEVFRAITKLSPDIISIISTDGILTFNSPAAEEIHGYTEADLVGRNTFEMIHPDDRENCQKSLQELMIHPEKHVVVQYRYLNKNGTYAWMEATASNQIHNPLINGIVTISRDISLRKALEQELGEALKLRDNFISIVSHELKTPVTSIKLQLQMLQRSGRGLHQDESILRSENLPAMIDQVNALDRLIDDLLQVSRLRNAKLVFEMHEEDLSTIVKETCIRFREILKNVGCTLEVGLEEKIEVLCDRRRVEQVLSNLFSNVQKYAPGKPVKITLKKVGNQAVITLKDGGVGIPLERQGELFKLFGRVTDSRSIGGLGVGLYISRSILEQHQGTIEVKSESGKGAEFILKVPALK